MHKRARARERLRLSYTHTNTHVLAIHAEPLEKELNEQIGWQHTNPPPPKPAAARAQIMRAALNRFRRPVG